MPDTTGGSRGGNLRIDRQITQLGLTRSERRIRVTVRSTDPKVYRHANTIIDKLVRFQQWEVLRGLRDDKVSIHDLIEADRAGRVHRDAFTADDVKLHVPLWDRVVATEAGDRVEHGALSQAFSKMKPGASRDRYIASFKALQSKAADILPADAVVNDLLTVDWESLYECWRASNADWMRLRQGLSKFPTLYLNDKFHPFGRELRAKVPTKTVERRMPDITIETFFAILERCPVHAQAAYWVLAITGVRRGEYLRSRPEHLNAAARTYNVPATKNTASRKKVVVDERWWPYLERGIPSRLKEAWLRRYWKRACLALEIAELVPTGKFKDVREKLGPGISEAQTPRRLVRKEILEYRGPHLHDLRHCFGQWAINAGVPESKVQVALRHATAGMTRQYVMQRDIGEVSSALADAVLARISPARPTQGRRPDGTVGGRFGGR